MAEKGYKTGKVVLTVCCPLAKQFKFGECSNEPVEWCWKSCGHRDYIDDQGFCHCIECGKSNFIQELGFSCSSTTHGTDYVSYKIKDMVFAL